MISKMSLIKKRENVNQLDIFGNQVKNVVNDDFYTPENIAKKLTLFVPFETQDTLLDNAIGKGAFFNQFPQENKKEGYDKAVDFLQETRKFDWLITNPPYSFLNKWLEKSCKVANKGFAYLLLVHHITPKRLEMCEKYGFHITKIHFLQIKEWFGFTLCFIVWEKNKKSIISYS